MSKDNTQDTTTLSGEVKGKIADIKNVDGRLNTLNSNINPNNDPISQYLQSEEYITSTLEGLAGKTINEAVTNEDIQNLVNNLHKEQYAQAVKNKALEILKQNPNITTEQLQKYENFITQGDKNQKYDAKDKVFIPKTNSLSQTESQALQEAATIAVQQINDRLAKNKEKSKDLEQLTNLTNSLGIENSKIKSDLLLPITKLPPEELQEKGSQIVKNFTPLLENSNPAIVNGAKKVLTELDPKYLAEAGETIADNIQKASKTTLLQKIKKIFTHKDYAQQNVDKALEQVCLLQKFKDRNLHNHKT